ncbi:MAG: alpha/beta hydrolase [Acidobacteriota bacterium]|nr:MAG: alpha/beta hydrolase [Acidobacteriota bacterium]
MAEMKNGTHASSVRGSARWKRAYRLPILLVILFMCFRWIEHKIVYHPDPYVAGPRWTPPRNAGDVWIPVTDSQRIHGWYFKSGTQPASATILYCHGNGGNISYLGWFGEALSRRGFDVLLIDYRGYGRSDGSTGDERQLYQDVEKGYEFLAGKTDPGSIVLYGQSLGTTAAIDVATRRECRALIVESGLSSASDMGKVAFPWMPRWMTRLARNKFDSAGKIGKVKCPVLIAHGTADPVIPVDQGRKLFELAKEPKELIIIPGGDHFLVRSPDDEYLDRLAGFITRATHTASTDIPVKYGGLLK